MELYQALHPLCANSASYSNLWHSFNNVRILGCIVFLVSAVNVNFSIFQHMDLKTKIVSIYMFDTDKYRSPPLLPHPQHMPWTMNIQWQRCLWHAHLIGMQCVHLPAECQFLHMLHFILHLIAILYGSTVEPRLSGHPRGNGKWLLNRGWPLNWGFIYSIILILGLW